MNMAQPTKLNFGRDVQGFNAFAPDFSTTHFSISAINGAEETFTVPGDTDVWTLSFSYQPGTVNWVARNATAAVPAGATFAATDSELNPGARKVYAGDVIHVITATATSEIGVSLYAYV